MTSFTVAAPAARTAAPPGLGWGLSVFIWLLPTHVLTMALLFGVLGWPAPVVRALAVWKEGLVAALLVLALARALTGHGPRLAIAWPDLAVAGLGLLALAYLAGASVWFARDLPLGAQVLGWRDAVFFTLVYFVGRASPEVARDPRYLRALVTIGVVTSVIAILERLLATPDLLVVLGAASYIQDYLGLAITTVHNPYGLPDSYWTEVGDRLVQRAGSTYLSSQGFAVPFLLILPAATVYLLGAQGSRRGRGWLVYGVLWAGLLLTVTRMTIVACLLQVILLAAMHRRWSVAVGGASLAVLGLVAALFTVPGFAAFVWDTLAWRTGSSGSHLEDWGEGVTHFLEHPLGAGLGAGGLTAARFGLPPLAADSQYFKYTVELGAPGLALFLGALAGVGAAGAQAFRAARTGPLRAYGAVVAVAALGLTVNGITTLPFSNPLVAFTFFWLGGAAVSAADARA